MSVLLKNAGGKKMLQIPLNPSDFKYTGDDGKVYPVNLWEGPPPSYFMSLPGSRLLMVSKAPATSSGLSWEAEQNPILCGIVDLPGGSVECVMEGNYLSISPDITHPAMIMVKALLARAVPQGKPLSSDPILFAWQPGNINLAQLNSIFPSETVPRVIFPLNADQSDIDDIGGYRLLCKPAWSPKGSILTFAAYETSNGSAQVYVMDFAKENDNRYPHCTTLEMPAAERQSVSDMISNDKIGYLFDSRIEIHWSSPDEFSLAFDGKRKYSYAGIR